METERSRYTKINNQKLRKVLLVLMCFLYVLVFLSIFFKPTIVLDRETLKPISGAMVNYHHFGMQGCSLGRPKFTNYGIVFSPFSFSRCQVTVNKEGYHIAGANRISTLPGLLGTKIILMNRITDPQELIKFKKVFSTGEGMDVLFYAKNYDSDIDPEKMTSSITPDFKIDGNKIIFYEKGGVQAISHDDTGNDGGSLFYDLDNLMVAPLNGYKQELELIPGKSYVARLRDGEHYMLFYMFQNGMTAFVNPQSTRIVESGPIKKVCTLYTTVYANDFSPETCFTGNYDIKIRYLQLKNEIEGDNLHLLNPFISGFAFSIKEFGTKYCFYLFPNEDRYSVDETVSLRGLNVDRSVSIKLPPYNLFKKYFNSQNSCLSIDVFVDGKHAGS